VEGRRDEKEAEGAGLRVRGSRWAAESAERTGSMGGWRRRVGRRGQRANDGVYGSVAT